MTITGTEAYEAMRAHHRILDEQLTTHVAAVSWAVAAGRPHEVALAGLVAYLAEQVLPHAAAEEETLYPAAAHGNLTRTISEMIDEHRVLSAAAGRLARECDGAAAAEQAGQIADLFAAHVARENDVLLPALLARRDSDLAALLAEMHHRTEQAG
jgi:iron-sulfur cluster repair protein YtfE (RIC family)